MEFFKCPKCGSEITDKEKICNNCGCSIEENLKNECIKCPQCGSEYFYVQNNIPLYRRFLELWIMGMIMPQTKNKYKDNMIYHCKKCDTVWNNEKIIEKGKSNGYKPSSVIPITIGIISILFSLILFVLSFESKIFTKIFLIISSTIMISGGIVSFNSIENIKVAHLSCILYEISTIILIVMFAFGGSNFFPFIISGIFFFFMKIYKKKLS